MRKIKEIQLIIFFSQCWHTLKWVSTVYICLTGWTSSVLCLIGVNPVVAVSNNSNNTSALNCQQLLPGALYLCAPQHYQALENTVFFRPLYSGWPLGVILWAFPRYSQHTLTYNVNASGLSWQHVARSRRTRLVRFLWYRSAYICISLKRKSTNGLMT